MKKIIAVLLASLALSSCSRVVTKKLGPGDAQEIVDSLTYVRDKHGNCLAMAKSVYGDAHVVVVTSVLNCGDGQ